MQRLRRMMYTWENTHFRSRRLPFNIWIWLKSAEPTLHARSDLIKEMISLPDDTPPPPSLKQWNNGHISGPPQRQR